MNDNKESIKKSHLLNKCKKKKGLFKLILKKKSFLINKLILKLNNYNMNNIKKTKIIIEKI